MPRSKTLHVTTLDNLGTLRGEACAVFSFEEITKELRAFAAAMKLPKGSFDGPEPYPDDDDWRDLMADLLADLGPLPQNDISPLDDWSPEILSILHYRVSSAQAALKECRHLSDTTGRSTGLLLPTSHSRRIATLLDAAHLPVIWVRSFDIRQF